MNSFCSSLQQRGFLNLVCLLGPSDLLSRAKAAKTALMNNRGFRKLSKMFQREEGNEHLSRYMEELIIAGTTRVT